MTRFARAKGSKSSNERKPEEATSWMEMKRAICPKAAKEPDQAAVKEKVFDSNTKTVWAPLGNDSTDENILLVKEHMKKTISRSTEDSVSEAPDKRKKKKKVKVSAPSDELDPASDIFKGIKNNKKKNMEEKFNTTKEPDSMNKVSDFDNMGAKRKISESNSQESFTKKKKKAKFVNVSLEEEKNLKKTKRQNTQIQSQTKDVERIINKKVKNAESSKKSNESNMHKINNISKKKLKEKAFDKNFKDKSFSKRNNSAIDELIVNGEKITIVKFQGFNVTQDDAERLKKLRVDMIREGIQRDKLEAAIKLERRRAEKALARLKKAVCFHCRGFGHMLSNCPDLQEKEDTSTGICYKCGSAEHSALQCKVVKGTNFQFAECFICKEQGHIARQCPDNPRGLYPQGGACRECGDVTHLRKDCPQVVSQKSEEGVTVQLRREGDLECLDEEIASREKLVPKKPIRKSMTVKF